MVDAVSKEILAVVIREAKQARENYLQLSNDLQAIEKRRQVKQRASNSRVAVTDVTAPLQTLQHRMIALDRTAPLAHPASSC